MHQRPQFIFVTCQLGAEQAVKSELARRWPGFRLAFSRPGFLTFRLPEDHRLPADFDLHSVFARAYGFSLGQASATDLAERARRVWEVYGLRPFRRLHVWERDRARPGDHGYEPEITPVAHRAREALFRSCPRPDQWASGAADPSQPAVRGEFVLDCVLVEPERWWVGYHRVRSVPSRWPGGMIPVELPPDAVSRAWLKMEEALQWSQLPVPRGARCAVLGSAPGGAAQALLARGLTVLGIDPAAMHPAVLAHPNFTHIRRRVRQVRRRQFRKIRWLIADMNVAPRYTLAALEDIVTHPEVHIRGILGTLKLSTWELAENLDQYLERVRRWGFNLLQARQLRYNRQEVCFAALKKPFVRKPYKRPA